ncbi:transmembrane and ubiquitin-like domain-containing protein 1 [Carassius auratus]|uniref:Transmembrane and ubiquitin-like domain-containing protein 1 n=1 Tax=Carassius auratus TaxID=7957 RepID=A0A6P6RE36_CARAU|nr:transmembrane and ubiquitin-like domain-containing protein 1 [Carassius auratus]XP_026143747.1 transmembrane and ubiquitin-like domain-containing protein 1 [Carassius auratus]XP_052474233.1 transmembrane and ubiquitin-like domain-containing protein 1 [Carassius gibelio]XP_052474240.1 transmembrane and ubiquitin-like domain-containing protein 1 [Carassius gibelio]
MALIEGVGDEVTLLFGVVFLVLVLVLAWASTHTVVPPEHLLSPSQGTSPSTETDSQESLPPGNTDSSSPGSIRENNKSEPGTEAGAVGQSSDGSRAGEGEGGLLEEAGIGRDGLRHRESAGPSSQPPASAPSATQPLAEDALNDTQRNMVLRLKFLNDTERTAQVNPQDTIGYVKRTYFAGQEHQVRLIYQGQLLQDDAQTLASLNLSDNSVLHCHISQNATRAMPAGARAADQVHVALNVGSLMVPLFVFMLSVLWYFQIQYRQFFTAPATASLVGITIFFSFVAFGVYRR